LTACGKATTEAPPVTEATKPPEPTTAPPPAKVVKITFVESWFGIPQFKEVIDPVTKVISEKMQSEGLPVEIESMILEDHQNKYTLLYASGADFTMAFDAPWYKMTTLRTQGALVALNDLLDAHGPKLKEEITEKIYNTNLIDGKLYGIPAAYYYGGTTGVIFREDLRKKYDVPMPTSEGGWRSLEPFLDAVMKNNPEMIPFANQTLWPMNSCTWARPGWGANGPTKTGVGIPDVTKGYTFINEEDDPVGVDAAKLLREWWEKGYINKTDLPSSASSQNAQVDFVYPGKAAACIENEPEYKRIDQTKQMQASIPDAELMGVDMTGARAGKGKKLGQLKQWNFVVFNINAPVEQQEAGIKFFNWLASSQDNIDLWMMGIDGVNYKKEPNLRFSEIAGVDQARNYRRMWYVSGLSGRLQRQPVDLPVEAEDALKFFSTESNWEFTPYESFEPDVKAIEVETAKLNGVYDEATHGMNTGQVATEEAVKKVKQMLDDNGRQEFKEKLQKQLDDYIAAHK
jgi:putative aldouronate transport system substrate-binding protein